MTNLVIAGLVSNIQKFGLHSLIMKVLLLLLLLRRFKMRERIFSIYRKV